MSEKEDSDEKQVNSTLMGYRLKKHAFSDYVVSEFKASGIMSEDGDYVTKEQQEVSELIIKIAEVLEESDRSECAINYIMNTASRLSEFTPLGAVTNTEDQWRTINNDKDVAKQHIRLPSLFITHDGDIVFNTAIIFSDPDGNRYTGVARTKDGDFVTSGQIIKEFPFTPHAFLVDTVPSDDDDPEGLPCIVIESQLVPVKNVYDFKTISIDEVIIDTEVEESND